jgi:hypothetical protein
MPRVGFEPMIPASKRAKIVHAVDHSATVTGPLYRYSQTICNHTAPTYNGLSLDYRFILVRVAFAEDNQSYFSSTDIRYERRHTNRTYMRILN